MVAPRRGSRLIIHFSLESLKNQQRKAKLHDHVLRKMLPAGLLNSEDAIGNFTRVGASSVWFPGDDMLVWPRAVFEASGMSEFCGPSDGLAFCMHSAADSNQHSRQGLIFFEGTDAPTA